ncbi:MAG: hypothetical protein ACR650_15830 [Methylocystis sp.]
MTGSTRLARTETFEHTISGLLKKRADLFNEVEQLRERLAELLNDMRAVDRVLGTLDYKGALDATMPRRNRPKAFGETGLTRQVLELLRVANAPLSSRDIAKKLMENLGQDIGDRAAVSDNVKKASRALRTLKEQGSVVGGVNQEGANIWSLPSALVPKE